MVTASNGTVPRILVVSHGYEAIYERGFCNGLSDNGFGFVLVSSDRTDYAGLRSGTRTLNLRGCQDNRRAAWQKAANILRYHAALLWHVVRTKPRVLHVIGLLSPPLMSGVLAGICFRLFAGNYALTVHDLLPHDRATLKNKILFHWSFRLATTLVVHTARVRQALIERHGISPHHIIVMEHGIEPLNALPTEHQARGDTMPWNILFFGKVMRYKGVDLLLKALAGIKMEFRLVIAGVGTDAGLTAQLEAAIAAHPQRDWIVWHNRFIEEPELPGLFGTADVVVLPYKQIDQSGILFQSLRYGVPIVATQVGSFADYVTPEVGELADQVEPQSFREALERCHGRRDSLTRAQVAGAGRRYAWQHTVRALAPIYRGADSGAANQRQEAPGT